ncbi:MAG: hypothetical protein ACYC5O_19130 [Anaerolineae bacterium]
MPQLSTSGQVLMLRGPKVLYMINVAAEPVALLAAFQAYRGSQRQVTLLPPSAAPSP